jgi:hypothetical protein
MRMTCTKLTSVPCYFALIAVLAGCAAGCGGKNTSTEPLPLRDREAVVAALPKGVTLETPVVPDKMYGEKSKTVEDALSSVQAHVRNGVLFDGGLGQEIRFESPGQKQKTTKTSKKPSLVIHLAN